MSWTQLFGETLPPDDNEAHLNFYLAAPDTNAPRVLLDIGLRHWVDRHPEDKKSPPQRILHIELGNLVWTAADWRRLSGFEIRADPEWQAAQETSNEYGALLAPHLQVQDACYQPAPDGGCGGMDMTGWSAQAFHLRLGRRDGFSFPCELDAWLIPSEQYWRTTPETPAELADTPQRPPDLRIVTRATFESGTITLPRTAAADPIAAARQTARELIACDTVIDPKVEWWLRHTPAREEYIRTPGGRSRVNFRTEPREQ